MWLYSYTVLNKDLCCKCAIILAPEWPITWPSSFLLKILKQPLAFLWPPPPTPFGARLIQLTLSFKVSKMVGNLVVGYLYSGRSGR